MSHGLRHCFHVPNKVHLTANDQVANLTPRVQACNRIVCPHFHSAQLVSAVGTRPLLLVYSGNLRSERSVTHNKGYRTSDHPSRGNIMAPAISIAVMCSSHWVHVDDNKVGFPHSATLTVNTLVCVCAKTEPNIPKPYQANEEGIYP